MGKEKIALWDRVDLITKVYKIRRTGKRGKSLETTIPREAFEREARRLGMQPKDAIKNLMAVWRFDNFPGLHLSFENISKRDNKEFEVIRT